MEMEREREREESIALQPYVKGVSGASQLGPVNRGNAIIYTTALITPTTEEIARRVVEVFSPKGWRFILLNVKFHAATPLRAFGI